MSERRRAEIEAKKAKLAELRKAREERQKLDNERKNLERSTGPSIARKEVDDLVESLIRPSGGRRGFDSAIDSPTSTPGTPVAISGSLPGPSSLSLSGSGRLSRQSDAPSDRVSMGTSMMQAFNGGLDTGVDRVMTPRVVVDLVDVEQELFELPQKERVTYNKEVQTMQTETETQTPSEDDIRERLLREREAAEAEEREKQLEEESLLLDKEIEQEIRDMTEEERLSIFTAPDFLDFVEQSTKIIQRALNDNYDYTRDYTIGTETGADDSEGRRVKRVCAFWDEHHCKNRSITDVDWSPKYPELSCASYNKNPAAINEPDGIVAVWNMHLLERPEFIFHSQSDVLSVTFSPFHSNLIFGGTYSGQILLWDTRSKHLPVLKTPLSASGHTHPVYAMQMVGTQNAHNLITSSTDGMVCSWLVDMLAQPQETLELVHAGHNKTGEVAITCLDFPDNETTTFWVGTEEGKRVPSQQIRPRWCQGWFESI
ncbi:hypothetical protein QCA50_009170 [Cerrena zonata]|uniref:Uncharacterized protein n=1 Tax=Cerrena zonata TaxID=2478898 RepID=A0AAW0G3S9_9APHY